MHVTISKDNQCWVCGKTTNNITVHHTLPQHLKPKKNVLVPVCRKCHEDINASDLRGMYNFTHKMAQSLRGTEKQLQQLQKLLEANEMKRRLVERGRKKIE